MAQPTFWRIERHGCTNGRNPGARYFTFHARRQEVRSARCTSARTRRGGIFQGVLPGLPVHISVSGEASQGSTAIRKSRSSAISQDDRRNTEAFLNEYGVTFPTLLDDPNGYAVSNAYGLTNVPTVFLIGQDGEIESLECRMGEERSRRRSIGGWRDCRSPPHPSVPGGRRCARLSRWLRVEKLIPRSRDKNQIEHSKALGRTAICASARYTSSGGRGTRYLTAHSLNPLQSGTYSSQLNPFEGT